MIGLYQRGERAGVPWKWSCMGNIINFKREGKCGDVTTPLTEMQEQNKIMSITEVTQYG